MQYVSEYWDANRPNVTKQTWKPSSLLQASIRKCFGSEINLQAVRGYVVDFNSAHLQAAYYCRLETPVETTLQAPYANIESLHVIQITGFWFFQFNFAGLSNVKTEIIPEYQNCLPCFTFIDGRAYITNFLKTCHFPLPYFFMSKMLKYTYRRLNLQLLNGDIWCIILCYCLPSPDDSDIKKYSNGKKRICSVVEAEELGRIKKYKVLRNLPYELGLRNAVPFRLKEACFLDLASLMSLSNSG
jgi:hypothetical protein